MPTCEQGVGEGEYLGQCVSVYTGGCSNQHLQLLTKRQMFHIPRLEPRPEGRVKGTASVSRDWKAEGNDAEVGRNTDKAPHVQYLLGESLIQL